METAGICTIKLQSSIRKHNWVHQIFGIVGKHVAGAQFVNTTKCKNELRQRLFGERLNRRLADCRSKAKEEAELLPVPLGLFDILLSSTLKSIRTGCAHVWPFRIHKELTFGLEYPYYKPWLGHEFYYSYYNQHLIANFKHYVIIWNKLY